MIYFIFISSALSSKYRSFKLDGVIPEGAPYGLNFSFDLNPGVSSQLVSLNFSLPNVYPIVSIWACFVPELMTDFKWLEMGTIAWVLTEAGHRVSMACKLSISSAIYQYFSKVHTWRKEWSW